MIYLAKAGGIAAAHACLGPLLMPSAVWEEVVIVGARRGSTEVPRVEQGAETGQVRRVPLDQAQRKRARQYINRFGLGPGESEVLALGADHDQVLLDERRATRCSRILRIPSIETVLLPALCVQAGVLEPDAARALLYDLGHHTTVRAEMVRRVILLIEEAQT